MIENAGIRNLARGEPFPGFDEALGSAGARVGRALTTAPGLIKNYTGYLAEARGKMIRAASLLACAQAPDGTVPADAVCFAVSVELLHLATLVHDDVIDDASLRRGVPTMQRKFGRRTAVICGDYLLSLALRAAAAANDRETYLRLRLPDFAGRVCLGELQQMMNNYNFDLTVWRYLKIIRGKTAALFEAAYHGGAILCTQDETLLRRYERLGRSVGMIFQLTDDCADFESDEAAAKKTVQSDYEQGVVTLPLIKALETDADFKLRARQGGLSRDALNKTVRACGGLDDTRRLSKRYYERAIKLVAQLGVPEEKEARLTGILDRAYHGPTKQPEQNG